MINLHSVWILSKPSLLFSNVAGTIFPVPDQLDVRRRLAQVLSPRRHARHQQTLPRKESLENESGKWCRFSSKTSFPRTWLNLWKIRGFFAPLKNYPRNILAKFLSDLNDITILIEISQKYFVSYLVFPPIFSPIFLVSTHFYFFHFAASNFSTV